MESQNVVDWNEIYEAKTRPIGVTLLSGLHILGALIGTVGLFVFVLPHSVQLERNVESIGFSKWELLINLAIIFVLVITSGIGMLLGKTWGWFTAAYYYLNSVARNGYTVLMIGQIAVQHDVNDLEIQKAYTKYGGRVAIHFLILMYLYRRNVLTYFGLQSTNKLTSFAILIVICIVQSFITHFLGSK